MARRLRLTAGALVILLALWALVAAGALRPLDEPWRVWVETHRVRGTSILAGWLAIDEMGVLALALVALLRPAPRTLLALGALALGAAVAVGGMKAVGAAGAGGWAGNFPSGHTTGGALLCGWLAVAVARWPLRPGPARALGAACWGLAALFGLVALYPMGHGPSEVLGGYLLALAAGAPGAALLAAGPTPPLPAALARLGPAPAG
jgi:membrane-associated phospholipid phosphatase